MLLIHRIIGFVSLLIVLCMPVILMAGGKKKEKISDEIPRFEPLGKTLKNDRYSMFGIKLFGMNTGGRRICIIADRSRNWKKADWAIFQSKLSSAIKNPVGVLGYKRWVLAGSSPKRPKFDVNMVRIHVILFGGGVAISQPGKQSWSQNKRDLEWVAKWVISIKPKGGGDDPMPAFKNAFSLKPPPDRILFISNGFLRKDLYKHVLAQADNRIAINTMQLGFYEPFPEGKMFMDELRYQYGHMNYIAVRTHALFKIVTELK